MGGLMAMTRSTGWWERPWFSDNQGEAIFSESLDHFHPALENFEDMIDWPSRNLCPMSTLMMLLSEPYLSDDVSKSGVIRMQYSVTLTTSPPAMRSSTVGRKMRRLG